MIGILLSALLAVVNVPNNSVSYTCNGVTAVYSVNFPYLTFTDLKVTSTTTSGAVTTLAYTTDYTVNFASTSSTATLTLTNPAVKCPNTNVLKIGRSLLNTQPYSFKAQTTYNQALHEQSYDRIVMLVQQISSLLISANTWVALQTFTGGVNISAPGQSLIVSSLGSSFTGAGGFDVFDGPLRVHDGLTADLLTLGTPLAATSGGTGAATAANNAVFAGPTSGGPLAGAFRLLVAGDVPNLAASKITTGTFADSFLASGYSGIGTCGVSTWVNSTTRNASPTCVQPAFTDISGVASTAQIPNLPASKITTGQVAIANGGTGAATTSQNFFLAGPTSGSGAYSFRALVAGDMPSPTITNQHAESALVSTCAAAGSNVQSLTIAVAGTYLISGTDNVGIFSSGGTATFDFTKNGTQITNSAIVMIDGSTATGTTFPFSETMIASFAASDVLRLRCTGALGFTTSANALLTAVRLGP